MEERTSQNAVHDPWRLLRTAAVVTSLAIMLAFAAIQMSVVAHAVSRGAGIGDWPAFYTAATIVSQHEIAHLYEPATQLRYEHALFGADSSTLNTFPLPAFVAIMMTPLAGLGPSASFAIWTALNLGVLIALLHATWRYLTALPDIGRAAFVLCLSVSSPVVNVLVFGQIDLLVLGAILTAYWLVRRDRPLTAGTVLALGLAKPQLIVGVVLMLLVKREWGVLTALFGVGAAILIAPAAASPHLLVDHFHLLTAYPSAHNFSTHGSMMVNVRGAVVSVTGLESALLWLPALIAIGGVATAAAIRTWGRADAAAPQSWALALMLPLLCVPHMHMQSAVLFVAAWVLFLGAAGEGQQARIGWEASCLPVIAVTACWILSLWGIALAFLPLTLVFVMLRERWPEDAATNSDERRDEAGGTATPEAARAA